MAFPLIGLPALSAGDARHGAHPVDAPRGLASATLTGETPAQARILERQGGLG